MKSNPAASGLALSESMKEESVVIDGMILDIDYLILQDRATIRLTIKGNDGKAYEVFDPSFRPYFYFIPRNVMSDEDIFAITAVDERGQVVKAERIERVERSLYGKMAKACRIYTKSTPQVPKLSAAMLKHGDCYEYDIPFAKRYTLDKPIFPYTPYNIKLAKKENGSFNLEDIKPMGEPTEIQTNLLCFDIEVYNPLQRPRPDKDQVIMISYSYASGGKKGNGVITTKKINKPYVETVKDEKTMISRFVEIVNQLDIDIVSGYNSANFDIKYLLDRSDALKIEFNLNRFEGDTKIERHGLVDKVKIAGRAHVDMYLVTRFIAVVGAAEYIMKLNSYTLDNVYGAITGNKDIWGVDKKTMHQSGTKYWDGTAGELGLLADYSLADSVALMKIYDTFAPIMIALSKITGNVLSDVAVSTAGQLVEFSLMRYAYQFGEIIPNKPADSEMKARTMTQFEGAYVKTPDPGIYAGIVVFDFKGLYPSIIISHNIDPSTLTTDSTDYFESPTGAKFDKKRKGVMPTVLRILMDERNKVKGLYKKAPNSIELGSKSQALKIIANSLYGYLGYARSRYYSRQCAESVTAYGRQYIKDTIAKAEAKGYKVIYSDTDSVIILMGDKKKEDMLIFMNEINRSLPESMELELEDFYTRGVFVGRKTATGISGAKKKYALIAENGRIKIRGFELVRRDWSRIARDTQRAVLETILKEGSKEKAAEIVKEVVKRLREGKVPLQDLAINTQIRKSIDSYDNKSPEVAAAKKAVQRGQKTKDEVEQAVISYVITKHGNLISDKAELLDFATDYDPDYYINNQVIPATMRILKELDFDADELKGLGKQKKLGG